ncbi:VOC family protein [Cytobacillus spongiae]|jgi:catechol-2,3-dioxygenase|uniref:VOC family protein n=1 Tax=Cytobacillus spongiae TaxID=2901381 RepID=UPI001F41B2FB|nr:VOC family protein [Cytobacillus spongiae]UII57591.1 VOC family protein [Cytobacillus spongiae]
MSHFISHIATVEVPVRGLEESIVFYEELVGAEVVFKGEKNAMLSFQKKGVPTIYLVETKTSGGASFLHSENGVEHSIVDFYSPDLKGFYSFLQEKQIEVTTLNVHPDSGFGGFGFRDPSGNLLGVTNVLHEHQ